MRFIGGGNEVGFIAIGQEATGVIAIGQFATGVVAIGQVARGVFCLGQLSVGVVCVGQFAAGVGFAVPGIGGNGFFGLVPKLEPLRDYPGCTTFQGIHAGWGDGWVDCDIHVEHSGAIGLFVEGQRLPAKVSAQLLPRAKEVIESGAGNHVLAHIRRMGPVFVCDRLMSVPMPVERRTGFYPSLVARMAVLIALSVAVWAGALHPLLASLSKL